MERYKIILFFAIWSFAGWDSNSLSIRRIIKRVGIRIKFYPAHYIMPSRKMRKIFKLDKKEIPKWTYLSLYLSFVYIILFLVFLILFLLLDAKVMVMDVFHTVYIIFMWMDVIYSTIFIFLYNVWLKLMCYKSKGFNFKRCLIRRKNGTIQNNSFLCNLVFCWLGFEFIIH